MNVSKKHNLEFDWEAPVNYEGTIVFKWVSDRTLAGLHYFVISFKFLPIVVYP